MSPEGKYVVDVSKKIDLSECVPSRRVSLLSDSYRLHALLPSKVDPLVSLMKVEKVGCAEATQTNSNGHQLTATAVWAAAGKRCERGRARSAGASGGVVGVGVRCRTAPTS